MEKTNQSTAAELRNAIDRGIFKCLLTCVLKLSGGDKQKGDSKMTFSWDIDDIELLQSIVKKELKYLGIRVSKKKDATKNHHAHVSFVNQASTNH